MGKIEGTAETRQIELSQTVSHMIAIYEAVHSSSNGDYAIVAEDDILLPLDIDWDNFVESVKETRKNRLETLKKSQENDWAMLYLSNPNIKLAKTLWWKRIHNITRWGQWTGYDTPTNFATVQRNPNGYYDEVSEIVYVKEVASILTNSNLGRAYVVNKRVIRPVIEQLVSRSLIETHQSEPPSQSQRYRYTIDILASVQVPVSKGQSKNTIPSIRFCPGGANLASVLVSLSPLKQYMLMYPLVAADINYSTHYKDPQYSRSVEEVSKWYRKTHTEYVDGRVSRTFLNNLIEGLARLPRYIKPACGTLLSLDPPPKIKPTSVGKRRHRKQLDKTVIGLTAGDRQKSGQLLASS